MFDPVKDIQDFHEKFGLTYTGSPRQLPTDTDNDLGGFRESFLWEELEEYSDARLANDLVKQLDALVDLVYVVLGTSYLHGFDFKEAWRRVHEANMKKIRALKKSDSERGSVYDVVKPPGWTPPDLTDLVA